MASEHCMKDLPVSRKCLLPREAVVVSSREVWHGHDVLLWHVNPAPCVSILLSADVFNFSFAIKFSGGNNNSSRVDSHRDECCTDPLHLVAEHDAIFHGEDFVTEPRIDKFHSRGPADREWCLQRCATVLCTQLCF